MPRISPEARGAAGWRAAREAPSPPKTLCAEARRLWRDIVATKPADWFDAGSLPLLDQYCRMVVECRRTLAAAERFDEIVARVMGKEPGEGIVTEFADVTGTRADLLATAVKLSGACTTLATKLRLSVQAAVEWESRKNGERRPEPAEESLLGGAAVAVRGNARKRLN